jgi:hypothetical protein
MTTLDITPSPRVLRMLGQIDFAPWQCLAELIDNSIDAFLDERRAGTISVNPRIRITLPSAAEVERDRAVVVIFDNGSGMTIETLRNAVRAGYSGNDPVGKMGLFGMGFNISTARLGRRTEVWTTTRDAAEWTGIIIDFEELEKTGSFQAPLSTKPKTAVELEAGTHGTRIEISRLEPERIRSLSHGAAKSKTKKRLGKVYGRVMRDLGLTIAYDGDHIKPWSHCTWDAKRSTKTSEFGIVPARIEIDEALPDAKFCTTCWVWLGEDETICSACGVNTSVIIRPRRLRGWIGVQRYFDKQHYGFDLIRNGRVIENLDKSFFTFKNDNGDELFEYPVDATHWGGRFVGELEIDFVRVSHQKDSFDKLDPEWKHVVSLVRGRSPIQPMIAARAGLEPNRSPLARLFSAFRKATPGIKCLVPSDTNGRGINVGLVTQYFEKFEAGEAEYQSDEKWYELALQAEKGHLGGSLGADEAAGPVPVPSRSAPEVRPELRPTNGLVPEPVPSATQAIKAERDLELSQSYKLSTLDGEPELVVAAYRHDGKPSGAPYSIHPEGNKVRFDYWPQAAFFEESLVTPLDCLVVDLAQHFLAISAASPRSNPVSQIANDIRQQYFAPTLTSVDVVADEAEALLLELRKHYDETFHRFAPVAKDSLPSSMVALIQQRAFRMESATEDDIERSITEGRFARFLDLSSLPDLVSIRPELALDDQFFSEPYEGIAPGMRSSAASHLLNVLREVLWLAQDASGATSKDSAWRLRFARSLASLRLAQSWRV